MSSNSPDLVRFDAFGTVALVAATDPARLDAAVAAVSRVVEEFDRACSRFRPDSELSLVNAAAGSSVPVGPVLLEAVTAALRAAREIPVRARAQGGGRRQAHTLARPIEAARNGRSSPEDGQSAT